LVQAVGIWVLGDFNFSDLLADGIDQVMLMAMAWPAWRI
jgi:hypothetical protein